MCAEESTHRGEETPPEQTAQHLAAGSTSGSARSDRALHGAFGELPARVTIGEPLELVGLTTDEGDEHLLVELHNPSGDAYLARGKLIYTAADGSSLGSAEFDGTLLDPLVSCTLRPELNLPAGIQMLTVLISVILPDREG